MSSEARAEYKKATSEHYKTPISFAEWRVRELKKTEGTDIINRTIDNIIELVNAFLGQGNDSPVGGDILRVIVPSAIYLGLIIATFSVEFNFNIYRILALMLLYIISYTELKYSQFFTIFLLGIGFEMVFIILKRGSVES
jgi:hypothetical protein